MNQKTAFRIWQVKQSKFNDQSNFALPIALQIFQLDLYTDFPDERNVSDRKDDIPTCGVCR